MEYYKVRITETAKNAPQCEESHIFNDIAETFHTLDEVNEYFIDRYGKMPNKKRKVYIDTKSGETKEIGFLHSFWNKDWSHNTKSWFQTDWVEITTCLEKPVIY